MNPWDANIIHADLDAFYASVETLKDPNLEGKPVIVGGTSSRGVVTSASYEARSFGVYSAMPTSRARRLCPNAVFISPNFDSYIKKSQEVRDAFDSISSRVEPLSLDEAFLDIKGAKRMWSSPATVAEVLKDRVKRQTGLVLSVGVAPNKFVAKLASKKAKPDGVVVVNSNEVSDFLAPIKVESLWGVGNQTAAVLQRLGLKTIADITAAGRPSLERVLGSLGVYIAALASGKDDSKVVPNAPRKSLGAEETFERDLVDGLQIQHALLKLADRVAARLRGGGISARTVSVKVRLSNFSTSTRSTTPGIEIDTTTALYSVASSLLDKFLAGEVSKKKVRLLGISATNLCDWPASEQLSLEHHPRWDKADRALDGVRRRFGDDSLQFGALLEEGWQD